MNLRLPGFGGGPSAPPPPPPLPTRDDPGVAASKEKLRLAERQRAGRRASVLTPPQDELGTPNLDRPLSGTLGGK